MESYKLKQNFSGLFYAYGTPISTLAVLIYLAFAFSHFNSPLLIIYFLAIFAFAGYRYFIYIKRPLEIEVTGSQIKLKDVFGKITELTFADLTDIEINRRRELYLSFKETKLRGLYTFKDFEKFLDDVKKKNPETKFWGFEK
ncbi:MAG: hypothetical protein AB1394_02160 [Bacteroidota bacterium]